MEERFIMVNPMPANAERFTYADLLTWPEDERWELIDGFAYNMTPAPTRRHQDIVDELHGQFWLFLKGKPCKAYTSPFDVRLPEPDEDGMTASTVVQPDITIVCDLEKLDERGCLGSPTLVVEVLSPATAKKDWREKLQSYEQAGVPEYWIVSPNDQTLMVFTLDGEGRYGAPTAYGDDEQAPVGVLPGLVVDLGPVFAE
jgi:Uma2 family endonuclease